MFAGGLFRILNYLNIIKKPVESVPIVSKETFVRLTGLVIDNLEGGYYHPRMKAKMSEADQKIMGDSGETMFGLDRKHGIQLSVYPEWNLFWATVDKAQPPYWKHYFRGGDKEKELNKLASEIMYKWFCHLSTKYINEKGQQAIAQDERLMIHFSYASWNGEKWFERFSKILNGAVKSYPNDKNKIWETCISARTNSSNAVIRRQAKNMLNLIQKEGLL